MEPSGFILNQQLTTFVAGVMPAVLVGTRVAPLIPARAVSGNAFTFWIANAKDVLRIRDTKVGRYGNPNIADFGFTQDTGLLVDHGLRIPHPNDLIRFNEEQPPQVLQVPMSVRQFKLKQTAQAIWIGHEQEVVTEVETSARYATGQVSSATAAQKFNNKDADLPTILLKIKDTALVEPNVAVTSLDSFRALQSNPFVIARTKAVLGGIQGISGLPSELEIARVLEIDELIVGRQKFNSAIAGSNDSSYTRLWGNHFTMFRREDPPPTSDVQYAGTFATFFGSVVSSEPLFVTSYVDNDMGIYGGLIDKLGHTRQVKTTYNPGACQLRSVL